MKSNTMRIESTFLETRHRLLQLLKRRIGCSDTAEELVQEVYLRVVQQECIDEIANLPGYLFRVAVNLANDHLRKAAVHKRDKNELLDDQVVCPRPMPDHIVQAQQELERLDRLIDELPPRCRRIFLLRRAQNLSYDEIAEKLNISPRTVDSQMGKALRILRDRMSKEQ